MSQTLKHFLSIFWAAILLSAAAPLAAADNGGPDGGDTSTPKSRAAQFEELRRDRQVALREIETRTQRLRVIDGELESLRATLSRLYPQEASWGLSSTAGNVGLAERSQARIQLEKETTLKRREIRLKSLAKSGTPQDEIDLDPELLKFDAIIKELDLEAQENDEAQKQRQIEAKQAEEEAKARDEKIAENLKKRDEERSSTQSQISALLAEQSRLQKEVNEWTAKLDDTNFKTQDLIKISDTEGQFRQNTSLIFALLVSVVIGGFYYIAINDAKVRYAIFAYDSGIQFITLFSIVIAVILFGIIGVLEGKELSALLGGLSGYILGKYSSHAHGVAEKSDPSQ